MRIYPPPKQAMRIPVSKSNIGKKELYYAYDALQKGDISGIPSMEYVQKFEDAWADKIGRRYVDVVNSGTDALEVVLRALGIGAGDEVLVPAWTFAAPANAVLYVGATPVLVDIDPDNWTIDPKQVDSYLTLTNVRAIIAVDIFGHPYNVGAFADVLYAYSDEELPLIEDAAQAHGAGWKLRQNHYSFNFATQFCGSFGVASTFSLFANKSITTGEGGVILTDDYELADRIRLIRNHGMAGQYDHKLVGGNHRMNNVSAAIGVGQMERWDELIEMRNQVGASYDANLPAALGRRPTSDWAQPVTWLAVYTHPDRDRIVAGLRAEGIDARPVWKALCDYPIYAESVRGNYPVARKVATEAFVLPTWSGMPDELVLEVCEAVRRLL